MLFLATFIVGVAVGAGSLFGWAFWTERRRKQVEAAYAAAKAAELARQRRQLEEDLKAVQEYTERLTRPPTPPPLTADQKIDDKLRQATEITYQQSKLKLKDGQEQVLEYNNLELKKLDLLKSILREGHDPLITVRYSDGDHQMNLSRYIETIQRTLH